MSNGKTAVELALEKAAKKEGLTVEEYKRTFELAGKVDQALEKVHKEAAELGPEGMLNLQKTLKARANEDAEIIGKLRASRAIIERMPKWQDSDYKEQHDLVVQKITSILKKNPYAEPLAQKAARKHAFGKRVVYREEVEEIKAEIIPLTEACQGKEGAIAVPVQLPKKEGGTLIGWVRLEVRNSRARIEKTTSTVKFLEKYGTSEEGLPIWVPLLPPDFHTPKEEPFFPRSIREGLAELYRNELSSKVKVKAPEEAPVE